MLTKFCYLLDHPVPMPGLFNAKPSPVASRFALVIAKAPLVVEFAFHLAIVSSRKVGGFLSSLAMEPAGKVAILP
jgi:hypothetical protein